LFKFFDSWIYTFHKFSAVVTSKAFLPTSVIFGDSNDMYIWDT
jgi:hypothetical protein